MSVHKREKIVCDALNDIDEHSDRLTDWEIEFVTSLCELGLERMSDRQFQKLQSIRYAVVNRLPRNVSQRKVTQ